jgi:diguanylate cyclase (GGDEF)-like protein
MTGRRPSLAVALLIAAIAVPVIAAAARRLSEPAPSAAAVVDATDVFALGAGPVDLESLPGPHPNLRPRRLMATAALVLASILLIVYSGWRERYILEWVACWVFAAYGLALISRQYPDVRFARAAIGLFALCNFFGVLCLLKSSWSYARQPLPRGTRWGVALLLAGLVAGRLLLPRPTMAMVYFLMMAALGGTAAFRFLRRLPRGRSMGAVTLGLALAVVAGSNTLVAFSIPSFSTDGLVVFRVLATNALACAFAAVGMQLLVFDDMTRELRVANAHLGSARDQLREAAITDPLTGCYNRRFLDEVAPRELERQRRYRQPLSVMFIDINDFKPINDRLGHQVGDRVLQHVAAIVRQQLRQSDYVFRWGGDEFVVILACDAAEASRKAAALKWALANAPLDDLKADVPVTVSVGVVAVAPEDTDILGSIERADQRMYQDKTAKAVANS